MKNLPPEIKLAYMLLKVANQLPKRDTYGTMTTYHIKNGIFFAAENDFSIVNYLKDKLDAHQYQEDHEICPFSPVPPGKLYNETLRHVQQWVKNIDIENAPKQYYFDFKRYKTWDEYLGSPYIKLFLRG